MIARFTTVPLIATLCIFVLLETGRAAGERMRNVLLLGVPASLPFIVWAVAAKLTTGRATGRSLELNSNMNAERWQSGLEILRSEEHTSELQSLMRTPYAVFCLKK